MTVACHIGPEMSSSEWNAKNPKGGCKECGGQCAPECGRHPKGCVFGGFSYRYWLIAEGCELYHGEQSSEAVK